MPLAAPSSGGSSYLPFVFVILFIGAVYLLFIRPQQKRNRDVQSMQSTLGIGDEVMTGSGVYGTVAEVNEEEGTISLEVSPEVIIRFARGAVARVVTKAPQEEEGDEEVEAEEEPDYETDETDEAGATDLADETDDDKVTERRD